MSKEEIYIHPLKNIIKDLANDDYRSFQAYLNNRFKAITPEDEIYIDKCYVDILYTYITKEMYLVLERMIAVLENAAEQKFGKNVDYAVFIMDELLPERLGVELRAYKKAE